MSGLTESHVSSKNNPVGSFIEATLNYFADASEKPVIYTYEPSPGVPRTRACTGFHHTAQEPPRVTTFSQNRKNDDGQKDRNGYWRGTGTGRSPGSPLRSGVRRGASSA